MSKPIEIHVPYEEIVRRRELATAYRELRNARPVAHLYCDPPFYCRLAGIDLQQTYRDPHAMIQSQILGWKPILEQVDCDVAGVGAGLVFGSFLAASMYGCEVVEQPGSIPGFHAWFKEESDLAKLDKIDPSTQGYASVEREFYHRVRELASQYPVQYDGGPVEYPAAGARISTYSDGPFTIACMIAGLDQISMWCYDQPERVHRLLKIITEKEIARIQDAFAAMGEKPGPASMADDYSPYISLEMYEEFVLPYQQQIRDAFGDIVYFHSCVPDAKLLAAWRDKLGITVFNGFKPQHGLHNLRANYAPVAAAFANRIVLEPDLDGANVMIATREQLREAVQIVYELFAPGKGLMIGATLCGGHKSDDLAKMNVIKQTIRELSAC